MPPCRASALSGRTRPQSRGRHRQRRRACPHPAMPIGEAVHLLEVLVEDVDRPVVEVRGEKEGAVVVAADRKAFVDGTVARIIDRDDRACRVHLGIPTGYGAALGCEDEQRGSRRSVAADVETASAVEHLPGGIGMVLAGERRDRYKLRPGRHSGTIIDCRHTRAIVRNPEKPGRAIGNAPGVDEVWINCRRGARRIRDQIGLREGDLLVFMMVMVTMVVIETHCVHGFLQFRGARISRAGRITRGFHAIPISR